MTLKNKHLKTFIQVRIFLYQSTRFKGQWQEKIGSFSSTWSDATCPNEGRHLEFDSPMSAFFLLSLGLS